MIKIEISSGIPWFPWMKFTFLRQYMTNIPKTAEGRYLPIYCIKAGVSLFSEKMIKGRNLVVIVPRTQSPIVIICCSTVMMISPFRLVQVASLEWQEVL